MPLKDFLFTSESVSEGHPDKMCDQISDAVLDALLTEDPDSRVALESLAKTGLIVLAGEITSRAHLDYVRIARQTAVEIGYDSTDVGFDGNRCAVLTAIEPQSADISQGVTEGQGLHKEQGAGDQGLMFGFACDETPEAMPLPIAMAHRLMENLTKLRKSRQLDFLRPDSKSQVTVRYADGRPVEVTAVVISTQHSPNVKYEKIRESIIEELIKKTIPEQYLTRATVYHVNPTGSFIIGGPHGDCGLTGRKIIVDTYGGYGRHGGGAFSGKDPSKVDRSACYMARHVAKNVVAAGLATKCEIQVAYAIGVAEPVSLLIDTFDTGIVPQHKLSATLRELFDFRPAGIIKTLNLKRPIYQPTAAYGHFGRIPHDGLFPWERVDMAETLRNAFGLDGRG
ncbi:methionine adenosyltransferase [Candidatus Binatus soli]|jgi:S-adenosylmethionine synthetase|uniref:methionine adenosyltransferase n=1 Tax=Candidatus Binatus soli TaxID=1953413 RepID=UPI003D11820A